MSNLSCTNRVLSAAQVKWYRGDNLIKQSRYYKLSGENHVYTLKISEVFPEDEGEYRCEATNRAGTASTSAFLKVIVSDGNESPPTLGHLSDLTATEGQSVTFTTQLAGTPRPKVTWYKGGQVIRPTRDFQVLHSFMRKKHCPLPSKKAYKNTLCVKHAFMITTLSIISTT